uniref:Exonuclease domain-containing protein 1 n=1 Tax=Aegilops tauschii TaxID=37682 RepID=M8AUP8_AEGTA
MAAIMAGRGQGLEQDFDFFVVVDFEPTCVKDARIFPQEIIEFPAVLVDGATGRIESAFRRELTGIRQEDVDGGVDLGEALWLHDAWLKAATAGAGNKRRVRLAVVTWGDWDCRSMLEFECRFKGIEKPSYFDQWINLRVPFQEALVGGGRVNLQEAVRAAGLDWEGRLHCGLDDACHTARLAAEIMRRGGQDDHHRLAGAAAAGPAIAAAAAASHKPLRWLICAGASAADEPPPPPAATASHDKPLWWHICAGAGADSAEAAAAAASHNKPQRWLLCDVLQGGDQRRHSARADAVWMRQLDGGHGSRVPLLPVDQLNQRTRA